MKYKKKLFFSLALTSLFSISWFHSVSYGCTTILVGKNATTDGSVMISRNEDQFNSWAKKFIVHPHTTSTSAIVYKSTSNHFEYTIGKTSFKYTSTPDWTSVNGTFEEAGINEYQVGVSATESVDNNETVQKLDPFNVNSGVTEGSIPSVLLPQVKTAREGIQLMGKIIETLGAGEAFGIAVADTKEAWYLECGSGHEWAAVRIPDDSYLIAANQMRIGEINLTDPVNYLGSSNLLLFAQKNKLYDSAQEKFNFAKIFGTSIEDDFIYNYPRVWWGEHMLTPSTVQKSGGSNYPLFLKPDKKIAPKDLVEVLRSHYEGSKFDTGSERYSLDNPRPINVSFTEESHILQLRSWLPNPIGGVQWLAMGVPETSVFVRFYSGILDTPKEYQAGDKFYDYNSAYWNFRFLSSLINTSFNLYAPDVIAAYRSFEEQEYANASTDDQTALALYNKNTASCSTFLTRCSTKLAVDALALSRSMESQIAVSITNQAMNK